MGVRCHAGDMKTKYLLICISIFSTLHSSGQLLNVSGKIIDEDLEELPGINIYDLDTTLLTTTDLEGTFKLENSPTKLLLGGIGYEWLTITVTNNCLNPEIIMLFDVLYHYKSHRKIDRLRKKRFDNRVNNHEKAYEQGIFKNEAPCIDYKFIPDKPVLDEIRSWMKQKKGVIKEELKQLAEGDTIYVPYGTTWRYDGTDRTALHQYSSYTDETEFNCIIAGTLINKDRRGNITFRVIDTTECDYEAITLNDQPVNTGDVLECNMKYFRVVTASNRR